MTEESIVVFLKAQISEFTGKMKEAAGEASGFGDKSGGAFGKFQQFSTGALLAVGAAAVAVGAYGLKMADEYEAAHARLETAVKNSGGDFEELKGKVAGTDKAMESLGFTNADTESSIATLTGATHDAQKAMGLQSLAADIARGRHIDLATATGILVKVETGHVSLLSKLGINTKDATGATISQEEAIKRLTGLYGGNAQAYTETFAGKIEVLKTKGADLAKNIGVALIPVIENLVGVIMNIVTFVEDANSAMGGWIGKLALVAGAVTLAVGAFGKLEAVAAGIPLIGGALGALLPPLALVAGAFAVLHIAGSVFSSDVSENAKGTQDLAKGLQDLAMTGKVNSTVAADLGSQMQKLASSIRGVHDETSGLAGTLASPARGLVNFLGLDSLDSDRQRIKQTQNALLSLYKTDPSAAIQAYSKIKAGLVADGVSAEQVDKTFKKYNSTVGVLGSVLGPVTAKQQAQAAASQAQITAQKALVASLDKLAAAAGPNAAKIAEAMGLTRDQVDALTESVKSMDSDFSSSFDSASSVLDDFKNKSHVDFQSFLQDQLKSLAATENWSTNIAQLAKDGIDKGFLQTLVKAGPAEAGLVQSILDNVKHGSIQSVNAIATGTAQAKAKTQGALNDLVIGATAASSQISALHPHIDVTINASQALQALADTQSALRGLSSSTITGPGGPIGFVIHGGAHAAGGRIGAGEWGTVGEAGSELAYGLPGGGVQIYPHGQQPASLSTASAGGGDVYVTYGDIVVEGSHLSARELESAVVGALRNNGKELVSVLRQERLNVGRLPWEKA